MSTQVYKIRDKVTGLFSAGGSEPRWTKKGRAWSSMVHLKSHIANLILRLPSGWGHPNRWGRAPHPYATAEVVVFEVSESGTQDVSVVLAEVAKAKWDEQAAKEALQRKDEADRASAKEADERAQLRRLQAKYPNG